MRVTPASVRIAAAGAVLLEAWIVSSAEWGIVAGLLVSMIVALLPILLPIHEKLATIAARTSVVDSHAKQLSDHERRITTLEAKHDQAHANQAEPTL